MTQESPDVTAAKISAERARARLIDTAQVLQKKLNPKHLAQNAWEDAKVKGADLAEDAVDTVKRRPLAATGVAAAIGLYLAREPLIGLAGKLVGRGKNENEDIYDGHEGATDERAADAAPANRI